jgi:hypothetical protein
MKVGKYWGLAGFCMALVVGISSWAASPPTIKEILSGNTPLDLKAQEIYGQLQQHAPKRFAVDSPSFTMAEIDTGFVGLAVADSGEVIESYDNNSGSITSLYGSWGVADAISGRSGYSFFIFGYYNLVVDSFTPTPSSAVSVVRMLDPNTEANVLKVTHDFHPASTPQLFECTVTIQNISPATVDLRYRTESGFWANDFTDTCVLSTMKRNGATQLSVASNNGLGDPDPLSDPTLSLVSGWPLQNADFLDVGPNVSGALFNLSLGLLAPGQSKTFYLYYGADMNQIMAMADLASVGAEAYALAKPDPNGTTSCGVIDAPSRHPESTDLGIFPGGVPVTAVMALKGVGGKKIAAPQTFWDDYGRSELCVAWDPGYYQWNILSGQGSFSQYVGTGQVLNANAKITSFPGDPATLNFTYSKLQKKASGYFIDPYKDYSPLYDKLTTDDPPVCMPFGGGGNN